ncbi:MAG: RICIN domain-containing protein [Chitinophagales bacterium]
MRIFNFLILFALVSFFSIFTSNNATAAASQFANIDANANYFIVPIFGNKAFDITSGSKANGAKVVQWNKHGGKNQQFRLEPKGSGYYMIVNVNSGKALDVPGASYNDGVQIVQWDKHGGENQQFGFEKVGTDTYIIINRRSKKALDVAGGSKANGAKITQYTKHGRGNQQFKLVKVATKPISTVVNGYSANYIDFGRNGNKLGVFEQIGDKKWREVGSKRGASTFNFVEQQRDEWSVYLHDKSRNVNIQLDLHTKKVMYSVGNGKRSPLYQVMNPSSKMNGWLASEVTYGNSRGTKLGTFIEKENKAWQEVSLKDGRHNFNETHRDQWSVYLHDKSRNVFIQLDLHTKKVMYSLGNKTKTYLYSISAAK